MVYTTVNNGGNNVFVHEPTSWEKISVIKSKLPEFISGSRLEHTLSVEKEALDIAKRIFSSLGTDEAYLSDVVCAALLHDITKNMGLEEQLSLCEKFGHVISDKSEMSCSVLHAVTGAYLARELFDINDCVFNAVYSHTVGNDRMNIIDKIIFLADYIEPTRKAISCRHVGKTLHDFLSDKDADILKSINLCIIKSIDFTLDYLIEQGSFIHIQTVKTRNSVLAECSAFVQ